LLSGHFFRSLSWTILDIVIKSFYIYIKQSRLVEKSDLVQILNGNKQDGCHVNVLYLNISGVQMSSIRFPTALCIVIFVTYCLQNEFFCDFSTLDKSCSSCTLLPIEEMSGKKLYRGCEEVELNMGPLDKHNQ
jgi:hypothetical protein